MASAGAGLSGKGAVAGEEGKASGKLVLSAGADSTDDGILYLSHSDVVDVALTPAQVVAALRSGFEARHGKVVNPKKLVLRVEDSYDPYDFFTAMPIVAGVETFACKTVWRNGGLSPAMRSSMVLVKNGSTKCIMDAMWITTFRTGGMAALLGHLLAAPDYSIVVMNGLGNCGAAAMLSLRALAGDRHLTVRLVRYHDNETRFKKRFADVGHITWEEYDSVRDATLGEGAGVHGVAAPAQLLFSAITSAKDQFLKPEEVPEGLTIVPIHVRGFQSVDPIMDLFVTDDIAGIRHFSTWEHIEKHVIEAADLFRDEGKGRQNASQRIMVYSYGIALSDLCVAEALWRKALDSGVGTRLTSGLDDLPGFWV